MSLVSSKNNASNGKKTYVIFSEKDPCKFKFHKNNKYDLLNHNCTKYDMSGLEIKIQIRLKIKRRRPYQNFAASE